MPDEALLGDGKITEAGALGVGAAARLYVAATKKERERHRLVYEIASGRAGKPDTWLALRTGRRVWEIFPAPLQLDVAQSRNTVVFDPLRFLEFLSQSCGSQ